MSTGRERFPAALLLVMAATLLALWSSELAATIATGLMAAALAWAIWREWRGKRPGPRSEWVGTVASFGYILVFTADLFLLSRNLLYASLRLLIFLSALRLLAARTDRERVQLLLLSFLAVVAATASSTHLTFGIPLAAYTAAVLWALACRQADRSGYSGRLRPAPVLLLAGLVLGTGIVMFFLIPHVGTGYFRPSGQVRQQVSGFSGRVELGSINRIKKNHEIVMRVRILGPESAPGVPLRWRGRTFDAFDGRAWRRTADSLRWFGPARTGFDLTDTDLTPELSADLRYEVILEPIESRALFAAADPLRVDGLQEIAQDAGDGLMIRFLRRSRMRYRIESRLQGKRRRDGSLQGAGREYPPGLPERYLQLPPLDAGIPGLAADLVGTETDPYRMAELVEQALRSRWTYSLDVQDRGVQDPVARFLLEGTPGHCEYFATSMALLLRTRGIPTRVVTGFLQGSFSDLHGTYLVRQSDAHSWVEVYFPGRGWVEFDPTPAVPRQVGPSLLAGLRRFYEQVEVAWDTWIVGLDLNDQAAILGNLRDGIVAAADGLRAGLGRILRDGSWPGWLTGIVLLLAAIPGLPWVARSLRRLAPRLPRPRSRSRRAPEVDALRDLYRRFLDLLARRGVARRAHLTPREFGREAARWSGTPGEIAELTDLFCRARYGAYSPTGEELRRARDLLRRLGQRS